MFCLGTTARSTPSALAPRAEIEVFALDFLRRGLPHCVLLGGAMPLLGPPPIRIKPPDATRLQEGFARQKDCVLPSPTDVGAPRTTAMIDRVPEPPRGRLAAHVPPPFVQRGREAAPLIACCCTAPFHGAVRGLHGLSDRLVDGVEGRGLLFHSVMTVFVLMGKTRAVARSPLAFRALSTLWCLTSGAGPGSLSSRRKGRPAQGCSRHRDRCWPCRVVPWRPIAVPWP